MKKLVFMVMIFFLGNGQCSGVDRKRRSENQLGLSAWGYGTGITGTYDYGFNKLISVGAGLNGYFDNYKNNDKDNRVFVFGRLNFHLKEALNLPPKLDIYPGVDVGVLGKDFGIGAHIGARYFFTEKLEYLQRWVITAVLEFHSIYNQIVFKYDKASRFEELFYLA
jgi:hypothetical protein